MSRNDPDQETLLPPHGTPPPTGNERYMPCHRCSDPTLVATLTQYGAMCFRCHEAYCREKLPETARERSRRAAR